mgnify:CR=1 FL=1
MTNTDPKLKEEVLSICFVSRYDKWYLKED